MTYQKNKKEKNVTKNTKTEKAVRTPCWDCKFVQPL